MYRQESGTILFQQRRLRYFGRVSCMGLERYTNVALHGRIHGHTTNRQAKETRSPADADKPIRRVSVKVTKHSTIPYAKYSFLLVCNSNFV